MRDRINLAAKVTAVNKANKAAKELQPILRKVFESFVGKSILKKEGDLLAKVHKLVPALDRSVFLNYYRNHSQYSLSWTVKTCVPCGDHGCVYHETGINVGSIQNGVLTALYEPVSNLRTDYTVEAVEEVQRKAAEAKEAYETARNACQLFGE